MPSELVIPGPYEEYCDDLLDELVLLQSNAGDEVTHDFTRNNIDRLHRRKCKHVRTPYELAERGFVKFDNAVDPRDALLQFMVSVIPDDGDVADILNNYDQTKEKMISHFETHFTGENYATIIEMIDNVPCALSPVKARPVYIQAPDGDKTMLVEGWHVSTSNSMSPACF